MDRLLCATTPCCKFESSTEEILLSTQFDAVEKDGVIKVHQTEGEGEVSFHREPTEEVREEKLDMTNKMAPLWSDEHLGVKDSHAQPIKQMREEPAMKETGDSYNPALAPIKEQPVDAGLPPIKEHAKEDAPLQGKDAQASALPLLSPRGDYVTGESRHFNVDGAEMLSLERHVAKLAGSPLGCIEFEQTFRTRQMENHIIVLKGHSLEGMTFGDVCSKYRRVTVLGLRNGASRVIWVPAAYIRVQASDDILLIECTPFALAMGLSKEASLAQSSLSPRSSPPTTPGGAKLSFRSMQDKPVRRCCV